MLHSVERRADGVDERGLQVGVVEAGREEQKVREVCRTLADRRGETGQERLAERERSRRLEDRKQHCEQLFRERVDDLRRQHTECALQAVGQMPGAFIGVMTCSIGDVCELLCPCCCVCCAVIPSCTGVFEAKNSDEMLPKQAVRVRRDREVV
eukprot:1307709-Rhodomonas_salina.1